MVARTKAPVSALAEELRPAILRLGRHLRRVSHRVGASALDAQLLAIIARREGIGVSEMAELEQIAKASMSAHIKRLEEAGWIVGKAAHEDKRRVGLFLTRAGKTALEDMRRVGNDWLAERLSKLGGSELDVLCQALEPLVRLSKDSE